MTETPDLFAAAAERDALATGKSLLQARIDLEYPAPSPLPADSLFGAGNGEE